MNGRTNPFLYGRPLDSGEGLLGRDAELEQLLGCVRSGRAVMVYVPDVLENEPCASCGG
jgi:hypothetical protein